MKKLLVAFFVLFNIGCASAEVQYTEDIGVGLNGSSFLENTPARGFPLYGSSLPYVDLGMILQKVSPFWFENTAQAGGTVWDGVPGPQNKGTVSQHNELIERFTFAGVNRMKYELLDGNNACMHWNGTADHEPCSPEEMQNVFDQFEVVIADNTSKGITTLLTGWFRNEDIDRDLIIATYQLPWFISEDDLNMFLSIYEQRRAVWQIQYDVIVRDVWHGMSHIGDGLHPKLESQYRAAFDVLFAILCRERADR